MTKTENDKKMRPPAADEWQDFAAAMQDVEPLKGKQTFVPKQPTAEEELQARKKAAEEFSAQDDENFLTWEVKTLIP